MNSSQSHLRWSRLLPAFALLCFLAPATAHAHVAITNIGELANGAAHPLMTPAHLLILLGLGLWVGQHSTMNLKPFVMVYVPLTGVALALTLTGFIAGVYQPILICLALCVATLVVLEKSIPPVAAGVLFAVAALALGFDSAVEGGITTALLKSLLGTWSCLVVAVFTLSYYISLCTKMWMRVGIRVLGSWIIAISLLVLAFSFRK